MYVFKAFEVRKVTEADNNPRPLPRVFHRSIADESTVYVFGGLTFNGVLSNEPSNDIWKFNFATKKWRNITTESVIPAEAVRSIMHLDGTQFFIFYDPDGEYIDRIEIKCNGFLKICNFYSGAVLREANMNGPSNTLLYNNTLSFDEPYIYCLGGTIDQTHLYRFDLSCNMWESFPVIKYLGNNDDLHYWSQIATYETCLYVIGGKTDAVFTFKFTFAFDKNSMHWQKLTLHPDPTSGYPNAVHPKGKAVQVKDTSSVFIFDNCIQRNTNPECLRDVWKLDLKSLQWTHVTFCCLPGPSVNISVTITPTGRMCFFSGVHKNPSIPVYIPTDHLYSAWMCIPKLSEICWDAVNHYCPNLSSYPKAYVLKLGVPPDFVERLYL